MKHLKHRAAPEAVPERPESVVSTQDPPIEAGNQRGVLLSEQAFTIAEDRCSEIFHSFLEMAP